MKTSSLQTIVGIVAILITAFTFIAMKAEENELIVKQHQQDSLAADRAMHVKKLKEKIKGKETLPADSVFKDIQTLKGIPAGRMLAIMEYGYSRSLGVSCGHCHNINQWESSEKKAKEVARQMSSMVKTINNDLLKQMSGLKSNPAFVNCTTCHRGAVKPAVEF
jgi:hypothetical protein